jgi:ATP-dependent Clp protease ATP-binding subunit ClpA
MGGYFEATDFLIQEGYSPDSGARGLERTIEKELSIPLSKLVLEGSNRRVGVFHIDHKCGDIVLTISKIEF